MYAHTIIAPLNDLLIIAANNVYSRHCAMCSIVKKTILQSLNQFTTTLYGLEFKNSLNYLFAFVSGFVLSVNEVQWEVKLNTTCGLRMQLNAPCSYNIKGLQPHVNKNYISKTIVTKYMLLICPQWNEPSMRGSCPLNNWKNSHFYN